MREQWSRQRTSALSTGGAARILIAFAMPVLIAGCDQAEAPASPEIRPVRAVKVEERDAMVPIVLTGTVRAEDEVALAFRIAGRMIERPVNRGDAVVPGQVVARLETQNEQNAMRAAQAGLVAAAGQVSLARVTFSRQQTLAERGFAARARYDEAREGLQTAESQLEIAEAQLRFAQDQLGFAELRADAPGVVVAVGAEPGEVVQTGQMIIRKARQDGRDAVFDVPAELIRSVPADVTVDVFLTGEPGIRTTGRVREVSPEADPQTRTFEVKIGLADPPPQMRLGATVTGRVELDGGSVVEIRATALTCIDGRPAVWLVDPASMTVALRTIEVARFDSSSVVVAQGLAPGELVVTAGVLALHPGQKVRLAGGGPGGRR